MFPDTYETHCDVGGNVAQSSLQRGLEIDSKTLRDLFQFWPSVRVMTLTTDEQM